MFTALVFSIALAAPAATGHHDVTTVATSADSDEAPGFFEENWPIALDSDLHPEIYERRVVLWAIAALTWPIAGIVWAPGLILKVDVDDDHSGEAWSTWFKQMAPFVCCGPAGGFYATFALIYMGPVRTINLYNRHVITGTKTASVAPARNPSIRVVSGPAGPGPQSY